MSRRETILFSSMFFAGVLPLIIANILLLVASQKFSNPRTIDTAKKIMMAALALAAVGLFFEMRSVNMASIGLYIATIVVSAVFISKWNNFSRSELRSLTIISSILLGCVFGVFGEEYLSYRKFGRNYSNWD
jgi:chromate transport protein ChrA